MNPAPLFIDAGHTNRRKWNQNVSGDAFVSRRFKDEGRLVAALSDGLGSGVKASILATMTAEMALRFVTAGADLLRSSEVMMEALPVCQTRKIAYATFSIVDCDQEGGIRVVEEGNPEFVLMRGCSEHPAPFRMMNSKRFPDRSVRISETSLEAGDRVIVCSDGVTQAGMGTFGHPLGWRREGLADFLADELAREPEMSSRELSRIVVEKAMALEPSGQPLDDVSCLVLHFRRPRRLMVMTGPPYDAGRDGEYAALLDAFPGRKAICGGSTAELVARELGCRIAMEEDSFRNAADVPPFFRMDGVDLVTEGILTLTHVARRLESGSPAPVSDAAGRMMELLLDSDSIEFLVGTRINEAHQDPSLPEDLDIRRNVMKRIAAVLRERFLKDVSVSFI